MKDRSGAGAISTGDLVRSADWAFEHRDIETLSYFANLLSKRLDDSLRVELILLARLCRRDQDLAARRWPALRDRLAA